MDNEVDFSGRWNELWSSLTADSAMGGLVNIMAFIGVLLLVMGIVKWMWDSRKAGSFRGGQGGSGGVWVAMILGAVLVAPGFVIPVLLVIFDLFANALFGVFENVANS